MDNLLSYLIISAIIGLIIGSFLNVVIYRLPLMMQQQWQQQAQDYLQLQLDETTKEENINLLLPRSHCPHCQNKIRLWENIPLISFILLRGRCGHCQKKISLHYPSVELLTAIATVIVVWHFGLSIAGLAALLLTWILIVLTFIDLRHQILPDDLTLTFLWIGLLLSLFHVFTDPVSAIIGAGCAYLSLWLINKIYKLIKNKDGMGYGDFKLFALLGAWLGWQMLPLIILLATLSASIIGIVLVVFRGFDRQVPIPFGPYLAFAGWIALLWGHQIIQYLGIM